MKLKNILCRIGIHEWTFWHTTPTPDGVLMQQRCCTYCHYLEQETVGKKTIDRDLSQQIKDTYRTEK